MSLPAVNPRERGFETIEIRRQLGPFTRKLSCNTPSKSGVAR